MDPVSGLVHVSDDSRIIFHYPSYFTLLSPQLTHTPPTTLASFSREKDSRIVNVRLLSVCSSNIKTISLSKLCL